MLDNRDANDQHISIQILYILKNKGEISAIPNPSKTEKTATNTR
jgi:hypothetical protein